MIAILRGLLIFLGFVLTFGLALKKNTPHHYQLIISEKMTMSSPKEKWGMHILNTVPTATQTANGWKWELEHKNSEGTIVQETWEINKKTQTLRLALQVDPTFYVTLFLRSPIDHNAMRESGIVLFEKTREQLLEQNNFSIKKKTED